ncbi:hypothetical protein NMG60_11006170 [Bertholletia excelsa]
MNPKLLRFSCLLVAIVILSLGPTCLVAQNENYTICSKPYSCANLQNISYPFWGGDRPEICGHPSFGLNCSRDPATITMESTEYRVLSIDSDSYNLTVVADEFWNNPSNPSSRYTQLSLFCGCTSGTSISMSILNQLKCSTNDDTTTTTTISYYYAASTTVAGNYPVTCQTSVSVRVKSTASKALLQASPTMNISQAIDGGFGLTWNASQSYCSQCVNSGGVCALNSSGGFACHCSDGVYPIICGDNSVTTQNGTWPSNLVALL